MELLGFLTVFSFVEMQKVQKIEGVFVVFVVLLIAVFNLRNCILGRDEVSISESGTQ